MQIQRNEEKCNSCMLCVKDCVAGAWREIENQPRMAAPQFCSQCGHCVAVCPKGAVSHDALDSGPIRKVEKELLSTDAYREIVISRRSIRQYRSRTVSRELIQEILELGGYAPTASNLQNVAYTVITDEAILKEISSRVFGMGKKLYLRTRQGMGRLFFLLLKMLLPGDDLNRYLDPMAYYIGESEKGRDYILHGAPVLVVIHGPKKGSFHSENCNIAAANIMNYAHARGLGSCYIGFIVLMLKISGRLRRLIKLPRNRRAYACIIMGYPAFGHTFTIPRKQRRIVWIGGEGVV